MSMHTLSVRKPQNIFESIVGLIGAKNPYNLLLQTRFGIHTFGVLFPIDVLILDDSYQIVRMKKSLPPNRIFLWPPRWSTVLELPNGSSTALRIHLGDTVNLIIS